MEEVVKSFTLIDHIGIFVPGAVLIALSYPVWIDMLPALIAEDTFLLMMCALVAGYVLGHALAQIGAMLDDLFWLFPFWRNTLLPKTYFEGAVFRAAYEICFPDSDFPETRSQQCAASTEIFRYVQKDERPARMILFTAFYTMSRALFVTLILTAFLPRPEDAELSGAGRVVCGGLAFLFFLRWIRFEKRSLDEARRVFLANAVRKEAEKQAAVC